MSLYIVIGLFIGFFIMEFIGTRQVNSIVEKKVIESGIYALITWTIYLFGIYELITNVYYAIPAIIGGTIGTMAAVYYKK